MNLPLTQKLWIWSKVIPLSFMTDPLLLLVVIQAIVKFSASEEDIIQQEISKLLAKGVIAPSQHEVGEFKS